MLLSLGLSGLFIAIPTGFGINLPWTRKELKISQADQQDFQEYQENLFKYKCANQSHAFLF